jgi:hypothetical protein
VHALRAGRGGGGERQDNQCKKDPPRHHQVCPHSWES